MYRIYTLLALLVFFINVGFSQDLKLCKTPEMNKLMQEKHPEMKQERIDLEKFTKQYIANKNITDEVYVIPIVFHIVHNNGTENISKFDFEAAEAFFLPE